MREKSPYAVVWPQNPSIVVSLLHKICHSTDFEALELYKGQSGARKLFAYISWNLENNWTVENQESSHTLLVLKFCGTPISFATSDSSNERRSTFEIYFFVKFEENSTFFWSAKHESALFVPSCQSPPYRCRRP